MLDLNRLYNMDCMEGMAQLPDKYFELAIVDPPYGIGEDGARNKTRSRKAAATQYRPYYGGDKEPPPPEYFAELFRVSKHQIIWGANHFIDRIGKPSSCWIVWDKVNGGINFADCELAWTSFRTSVRLFRFMWNGMQQGKSERDGATLQGNHQLKETRIHPNQKPAALYRWLLQNYTNPGDKLLDTHAGSASSFVAAREMGHDYIGFEIDLYYYGLACDRVEAVMAQTQLKLR